MRSKKKRARQSALLLRSGRICHPWLCCAHKWRRIRDDMAAGSCSCNRTSHDPTVSRPRLFVALDRAGDCTLLLCALGQTRAWFAVGSSPDTNLSPAQPRQRRAPRARGQSR